VESPLRAILWQVLSCIDVCALVSLSYGSSLLAGPVAGEVPQPIPSMMAAWWGVVL
jgi:hypothetical protein